MVKNILSKLEDNKARLQVKKEKEELKRKEELIIEGILSGIDKQVEKIKIIKETIKEEENEIHLLIGKLLNITSYKIVKELTGISSSYAHKYREKYYDYLRKSGREDLINVKKTALTKYLLENNKIKEENIKYYE